MRALLVVNPKATGTTARSRDVLATALAADLKVEIRETEARGHATELARQAAEDGVDHVVALGGDGTVNEVVNGVLAGGGGADEIPALGIVPGGCTNVLARTLGLPVDPIEATAVLLDALRAGRTRRIGLGRADGRWFTFCAGLGIDAATVQRVEGSRKSKQVTPWRYARAATREYFFHLDHGTPPLTVEASGLEPTPAFVGLVCNTAPWTYLGDRPVNPCPEATFESGLDLFGLRKMRPLPTMKVLAGLFGKGPHGRNVLSLHDCSEITVRAHEPTALQVDGDFLGNATSVTFRSVPEALRVLV